MSKQQLFGLRRDVERDFKQRSEHFKMSAFGSIPLKPATVEDAITADTGWMEFDVTTLKIGDESYHAT